MYTTILISTLQHPGIGNSAGYIAGAVIGLLLLIYLLYSLFKPDHF